MIDLTNICEEVNQETAIDHYEENNSNQASEIDKTTLHVMF